MNEAQIRAALERARACYKSGDFAESEALYRQIVEAAPRGDHYADLGVIFEAQRKFEEAGAAFRKAIELSPRDAHPHYCLGNLLRDLGKIDEALQSYGAAVALAPTDAVMLNELGWALILAERPSEAIEPLRKSIAANPRFDYAYNNLGSALYRLDRPEEAIPNYLKAIELSAANASAHDNLGSAYSALGRFAEAVGCHRRAIELKPDFADAHVNLALAYMKSGNFKAGWDESEWRWAGRKSVPRRYDFSPWQGQRSAGGKLLLWGEQGLGDELIYASMLPELLASGLDITLESDRRLALIMQRSFPAARIVGRDPRSPLNKGAFDWQCPLGGLGKWLRPDAASFPRHAGYLQPDANRARAFSLRVHDNAEKPLVAGISWRSANLELGAAKSIDLDAWSDILRVPGVRFVDLQYGDTREARSIALRAGIEVLHLDDLDLFDDLDGLAALCAACDLVVTTSNVTAHVAGALGRPVWMLAPLGFGRVAHWLDGRTDSPWYPSMRIFSQLRKGSWREPLAEIGIGLAKLAQR